MNTGCIARHAEAFTPTAGLAGLRLHLCAAGAGPPGLEQTEAQAPLRQQPSALQRPGGVHSDRLPQLGSRLLWVHQMVQQDARQARGEQHQARLVMCNQHPRQLASLLQMSRGRGFRPIHQVLPQKHSIAGMPRRSQLPCSLMWRPPWRSREGAMLEVSQQQQHQRPKVLLLLQSLLPHLTPLLKQQRQPPHRLALLAALWLTDREAASSQWQAKPQLARAIRSATLRDSSLLACTLLPCWSKTRPPCYQKVVMETRANPAASRCGPPARTQQLRPAAASEVWQGMAREAVGRRPLQQTGRGQAQMGHPLAAHTVNLRSRQSSARVR